MSNRRLRQAGQQLRRKGRRWYGLLGNHEGVVEVPDRSGYFYVRLPQAGGSNYAVAQFRARGVPAYLHLPVLIEQDPLTGERYISSVDYQMVEYGAGHDDDYEVPGYLEPHNDQHEFGGADQLDFLDTRQLYALRVQPTGNACEVLVQAGAYSINGSFYFLPESQTVDLSDYAPDSAYTWCMLYIDQEGAISIHDVGQIYSERHGDTYRLGTAPDGTSALGLVKIEAGIAPDWAKIVDLRFSPNSGGSGQTTGELTEVLDQNHAPASFTGGTKSNYDIFQQFQVSQVGQLNRLQILFGGDITAGTVISVHEGSDGDAPEIARGTLPAVTASTLAPAWGEVVLSEPVEVSAGITYTFWIHGMAAVRRTYDNTYAAGRAGTHRNYLSPLISGFDLYFKIWLLLGASQYVRVWNGGIHISTGDITLGEGGLVDGVDVSTIPSQIAAIQHALRMENYHLRRDVYQLQRQVQALTRQFDLVMTKHAMTEG